MLIRSTNFKIIRAKAYQVRVDINGVRIKSITDSIVVRSSKVSIISPALSRYFVNAPLLLYGTVMPPRSAHETAAMARLQNTFSVRAILPVCVCTDRQPFARVSYCRKPVTLPSRQSTRQEEMRARLHCRMQQLPKEASDCHDE